MKKINSVRQINVVYEGETWNARKLQEYSTYSRSWCYTQLTKVITGEISMSEVLKKSTIIKKKFLPPDNQLTDDQLKLLNDFKAVHAGKKSVNQLLNEE